jgi:hypothetical protein
MLETSYMLIVLLLGEPNPDFAEMGTRGLSEKECQARAAIWNRGRGTQAYCAVSFSPVTPNPTCAHAGGIPARAPGHAAPFA